MKYKNLKAEMAKRNDTIKELGYELGISENSMASRVHGKIDFKMVEIKLLIKRYDVTFEYLFEE